VKDSLYEQLECVFDKFPEYHTNILLDFSAKVGKEDIFIPTIGNESLHEISNGNGVRVVYFSISKNLTTESTMFPRRIIHKCNWTFPEWKIHNQIDHILVDRRRHSNVLDVRSLRPQTHVHIPSLRSFIQRIRPGPRFLCLFCNKFILYGEGWLASRTTSKMDDHPLSFVHGCLFYIFAAPLHSWRLSLPPQPEDAPCCGDKGGITGPSY
jgi:hypothetical protein